MLLDFIIGKKDLVHPNVVKMVQRDEQEGYRMALNEIHYGSLQLSREAKEVKEMINCENEIQKTTDQDIVKDDRDQQDKEDVMKFIFAHKNRVKLATLKEVAYNSDKAIYEAFKQIHVKSLEINKDEIGGGKSKKKFVDVVKENMVPGQTIVKIVGSRGRNVQLDIDTLFFTGFEDDVKAVDLWKTLKQIGRIKDIILPRKRDIYNKRFGFIKLMDKTWAEMFLRQSNRVEIKGKKIRIEAAKMVKNKRKSSLPSDREKGYNFKPPEKEKPGPILEITDNSSYKWLEIVGKSVF